MAYMTKGIKLASSLIFFSMSGSRLLNIIKSSFLKYVNWKFKLENCCVVLFKKLPYTGRKRLILLCWSLKPLDGKGLWSIKIVCQTEELNMKYWVVKSINKFNTRTSLK
jgi:hypothetical protein